MLEGEEVAQDNQILVGVDPYSDRLAVIPLNIARADVAMIHALSSSTTFGEVRQDEYAWAEVKSAEPPEDLSGDVEEIPDDAPFDWVQWFGDESFYLKAPLARLETAEYCPEALMAEFGYDDEEVGFVDYVPAKWLSPTDQKRIEARLVELGYEVVHNSQLLNDFNY